MYKALILASTLAVAACTPAMGHSESSHADAPQGRLDVSAVGEVNVAPDRAIVSAGVVKEGKTAREAMMGNATLMTSVYDELVAAKIPRKNITTSQLSLQPKYTYRDNRQAIITGYEARNTVTVKSDDLEQVGPMLDALVRAGVNNINNVQFTVRDPKSARDEARLDAIAEARAKAQAMANAAGVKLGPLLMMNEGSQVMPSPRPVMQMARAESVGSYSTPVSAGEQTLSVRVNLTYAIKD